MKFSQLTTTSLLTLTLTPLSALADPTTVLQKCYPLYSDAGAEEAWFIANLKCNSACQEHGFNGGGCDKDAYECVCSQTELSVLKWTTKININV
ncbi:uncharacterized protein CDV56_104280 [Aspergillus thermomutatus]|uniref:Invertebrate defensins family profile domain-containing protein n=1 Tax=Aspergillus thermomutatus TaxID=41047 RepID=A0A397G974_ASPTH|nr:uncharacterized protein CDV56_104280 [Aspergillus thermomutatus]RHZ45463.1 hypothetical protein CDV56_104280 [Aspergillus thermomutatus]